MQARITDKGKVEVLQHMLAERDAQIERLRQTVAQLTRAPVKEARMTPVEFCAEVMRHFDEETNEDEMTYEEALTWMRAVQRELDKQVDQTITDLEEEMNRETGTPDPDPEPEEEDEEEEPEEEEEEEEEPEPVPPVEPARA